MISRGLYLTDIHFGKRGNSEQHNQDCLDVIDWACALAKKEKIEFIAFLGDWHENRSALDVSTLKYSYNGAKKLNELGIPVYFCVGNHDLYHRHNRTIHSAESWNEFDNFVVIAEKPLVVNDIVNSVVFVPFLFPDEYPSLSEFNKVPFWAGHFEFQGFVLTGYTITMKGGPSHVDFKEPDYIVSGHFHKRQATDNIVYIGNVFPMDYSDANDNDRGCMIYDHESKDMEFHNWDECPKYVKTKLTKLISPGVTLPMGARVKCAADIPMEFDEIVELRKGLIEKFELRELIIEEAEEIAAALTDTDTSIDLEQIELTDIDDLVVTMLNDIDTEHVDNALTVQIYQGLKV